MAPPATNPFDALLKPVNSPARPEFRAQPPPVVTSPSSDPRAQSLAQVEVESSVSLPVARSQEVTVSPADSSTPACPVEPGLQQLLDTDWSIDVGSISLPTEPAVPEQSVPNGFTDNTWSEVEPVKPPEVKQEIIEIPQYQPLVLKQEIIEIPYHPPPVKQGVKQEIFEVPHNQWQPYQQQAGPSFFSPARARPVSGQLQGTFRPAQSNGYPTPPAPSYGRQPVHVLGVPHLLVPGIPGSASFSVNNSKPRSAIPGLENFSIQGKDPVQAIHEMCAKFKLGGPSFDLIEESGPAHLRQFSYQLVVDSTRYGPFRSGNKKECMKGAAKMCLSALGFSVA